VRGFVADINFQGQFDRLMYIIKSVEWFEIWSDYDLEVVTFVSLAMHPETRDRFVWERCQREGLVLVTGNRNDDGPDSLEATLRTAGAETLPVITIGNARRVLEDERYARHVVADLMDFVDDMARRPETVLGIGRLYLPTQAVS
jgi:hypothetical protein